jgi:acetate kinase
MNILVLNAGSSSLKFQIIATDLDRIREHKDARLLRGEVERIGAEAVVTVQKGEGPKRTITASLKDISAALDFILRWAASAAAGVSEIKSMADIHAVGHRVVHGGEVFTDSVLITDEVIEGIENCIDLAPLHNPTNLRGIRAMGELLGPKIPQVAVFDTAFHHSLSERSYLYAIPYHLYLRYRIRRYGFHGISHRYMGYRYRTIRNLPREQTNIVSLHLGNGCSAAAIRGGHSVDTSMGMTPLEGLVMGTRSGDLDPAVLGFIAAKEGLSLHEVEALLNKQSGLLGLSGLTHDMRVLQEQARGRATAAPSWPSIFSATGLENTSARSLPPWAAPTPSSSRAASGRIRPRSARTYLRRARVGRIVAGWRKESRKRLAWKA